MAAQQQHGTNFKLGSGKHENFQSDYRANYPERPIDVSGQEMNRLDYLKEKLRKTNLELEQFYPDENQQNTIYKEDFVQKDLRNEPGQDLPNLQKTNFHLGNLGPKEQKDMYVSQSKKGYVKKDLKDALKNRVLGKPSRKGRNSGLIFLVFEDELF